MYVACKPIPSCPSHKKHTVKPYDLTPDVHRLNCITTSLPQNIHDDECLAELPYCTESCINTGQRKVCQKDQPIIRLMTKFSVTRRTALRLSYSYRSLKAADISRKLGAVEFLSKYVIVAATSNIPRRRQRHWQ